MNILNNHCNDSCDDCNLFNKLPVPIFVINKDITVHYCNPAALSLLGLTSGEGLKNRHSGDVLSCINSANFAGTCGCTHECIKCDIRNSLNNTFNMNVDVTQKPTTIQIYKGSMSRNVNALITTFAFGDDQAILVIENITDVVNLQKLIPVCSHCKKVRSDDKYWSHVEEYIEASSGCDVTSGICPTCITKLYPNLTNAQLEQLKDKY